MFDYIFQNWLILLPVIALSVAVIYLIAERVIYYYGIREKDPLFEQKVMEHLRRYQYARALELLKTSKSPQAWVLQEGIRCRYQGVREMERQMEAKSTQQMILLERNVAYLSGIANIATLLGLFGTVTGMIIAFMNMNFFGISDPSVLAGGISQALVTTAAGLGVAIPALLFYSIFTQFISNTAARIEIAANELITLFAGTKA